MTDQMELAGKPMIRWMKTATTSGRRVPFVSSVEWFLAHDDNCTHSLADTP